MFFINTNIIGHFQCFKEGTLVQTENGLKPIEDIQVGDLVLAYDEETGNQAFKPVKQLFRNQTKEWHHILVKGEEVICTAGHPFYVAGLNKFVCARDLKVGDELLLSDGTCATIEAINIEQLAKPETTYNFEVADFHTYYVAESKVLVHNDCVARARRKAVKEAWKNEYDNVMNGGEGISRKWTPDEIAELKSTGKIKGYQGHHIESVKSITARGGSLSEIADPLNIKFVNRQEHLALHGGNWRNATPL